MDELLGKTLLEGGALVVLVVLVIIWMREQRAERKESASERVAMMEALTVMQKANVERGTNAMNSGLVSLDKVNGSIRELTEANVELARAMAVHDATSRTTTDGMSADLKEVLHKLDAINQQLAVKA